MTKLSIILIENYLDIGTFHYMNTEQETHILETPKIFSGLSKMASLCPELSHDRNASSQLKLSLDKVNIHSPYLFTKSSLFTE